MPKGKRGFQKGCPPWNKGIKYLKMIGNTYGFKKGQVAWNKGKKCPEFIGNKFAKGNPPNKTSFKKGRISWNRKDKIIDSQGYIQIYFPQHPFANHQGYVRQAKLVIESQINCYLKPKEISHHLNTIKTDNRPENLMAFVNQSAHKRFERNPNSIKPSEIIFDGRKL